MGTTVNVTSDNYDFLIWKRSIKIFPCFIFTGEQAYNLLCRKVINNFSYRVLRVYSDCKSIDTNLIFFLVFDRLFSSSFTLLATIPKVDVSIDDSFCSLSGTTAEHKLQYLHLEERNHKLSMFHMYRRNSLR